MTDRPQRGPLTLDELESLARLRGFAFSIDRLAAVLPEVQRLQEFVRRLQALVLDHAPPAVRYTPE